jgi:hypothetical protein
MVGLSLTSGILLERASTSTVFLPPTLNQINKRINELVLVQEN